MRVLIVGWGFIGSALGSSLNAAGVTVRALTSQPSSRTADAGRQGIDVVFGRLGSEPCLEAFEGVDHVVYAAGGLPPATAAQSPTDDAAAAILPAIALFQALGHGTKAGVTFLASGGTVYGNPAVLPVPESEAPKPVSAYGVSRAAAAMYAEMYAQKMGIPIQIVRCANLYGPGQPHDRGQGIVAVFLHRIRNGLPITIYGDGSNLRDYVYIDDAVNALKQLVLLGSNEGVLNLGSGAGTSTSEVLDMLTKLTSIPAVVEYLPARPEDVKHVVLDISRLRSLIDYRPRGLEAGIRAMLDLESREADSEVA